MFSAKFVYLRHVGRSRAQPETAVKHLQYLGDDSVSRPSFLARRCRLSSHTISE